MKLLIKDLEQPRPCVWYEKLTRSELLMICELKGLEDYKEISDGELAEWLALYDASQGTNEIQSM